MDARAWRAAKELLADVADMPVPQQRAHIEQHCVDPELRRELLQMLDSPAPLSDVVAAALTLAPGTLLGPYKIVEPIGAGGMGLVFRGRDTRLPRDVAIKILPLNIARDPDRRARFEREARAISQLNHAHICTLHDIGRDRDIDFLVMEYLDGQTLADQLARGPLNLDRTLQLGLDIAAALNHLHRHNVVHRDLKPSNVMLTRSGAKLLDFGIAKVRPTADDYGRMPTGSTETAPGTLLGTLAYMAPEQVQGQEADARTDIWAFGCVLYEALTGRRPFNGSTQAAVIGAILEREPDPLATVHTGAPALLDYLVLTCLAKDPEARWQSAGDIEKLLKQVVQLSAQPKPRYSPFVAALRQHPIRIAVSALTLTLLLVAATRLLRIPRGGEENPFQISTAVSWPSVESNSRLSPDGKWLSFISDRDGDPRVFLQNVKSGGAMPIAAPAGGVLSHVWSPEGQELAILLRQGQTVTIYVVPAFLGGAARAVARVDEPAQLVRWIGQTIYFVHRYALLGVDAASGASREIFRPDPAKWRFAAHFDVSNDGRVVFSANPAGNENIWLTNLNGAAPLQLTDDPGTDTDPVIAGHYVFFQSARAGEPDVWRLDLSDSKLTRVTAGANELSPEDATSDGTLASLAYSATTAEIWAMQTDTNQSAPLTSDSAQDFWPSLSRDGSVLAYQRRKAILDTAYMEGQAEIMVARWNGSTLSEARLAVVSGFAPRLSPDGRRLAYQEWIRGSSQKLVLKVLDLADGRTTTITERFLTAGYFEYPLDAFGVNFLWSPDSESLYYCEGDASGTARVARTRPGTPGVDEIVRVPAGHVVRDLWLSPDGRRLAYNRLRSQRSVYVVRDLQTAAEQEWFADDHGLQGRVQSVGWDGDRLLLLRSRRTTALPYSVEIISVEAPDHANVVRQLPLGYPWTARFDPSTKRIVMTLHEGRADNLFAVPLASGPPVRLTSNDLPSVTFSNVAEGPGHTLVFARHDRKQDIWLVRQTGHR